MALARWQATIVDESGEIQPSAQITVTEEGGGLAQLYSDRDGLSALGNPINADANGFVSFHVDGGAYRIDATIGAFSRTWRYVGIGTAAEHDFDEISGGATTPPAGMTDHSAWLQDRIDTAVSEGAGLVTLGPEELFVKDVDLTGIALRGVPGLTKITTLTGGTATLTDSLTGRAYLRDIIFDGDGVMDTRGVRFIANDGIEVIDCGFINFPNWSGLICEQGTRNVHVRGGFCEDIGASTALNLKGYHNRVEGVFARNCLHVIRFGRANSDTDIDSGWFDIAHGNQFDECASSCVLVELDSKFAIISNNTCRNVASLAKIDSSSQGEVVVMGNLGVGQLPEGSTQDLGAAFIDVRVNKSVVVGNYSDGFTHGFYTNGDDCIVADNTFWNCGDYDSPVEQGGRAIWSDGKRGLIHHNQVDAAGDWAIYITDTGNEVRQNHVKAAQGGIKVTSTAGDTRVGYNNLSGVVGQKISNDSSTANVSEWTKVTLNADETTASDTVLSASSLSFAVEANKKYHFRMKVYYNTPTAADFKFDVIGPASPTVARLAIRTLAPGASAYGNILLHTALGTDITITETSGTGGFIEVDGLLHNGVNAGTIDFRWAQNTSDLGTSTIYAGSYLEHTQL